jgi:hypothetical protein
MTMPDRGVHPDLLDEQEAPPPPAPETPSPRRGRASRAAPSPTPAEVEPAAPTDEAPAEPEEAEEPAAAEEAKPPDRQALIAARTTELLKEFSEEELSRDPKLAGWIGNLAKHQRNRMIEQERAEAAERAKREAIEQGDFYGLGQLTASEIQARAQQQNAAQQVAPIMDVITRFQARFPVEVQQEVQGKTFGAGKSYEEGLEEYLHAVTEAAAKHRADAELKRREPALRKAWLSESNGAQPVPELDGGRADRVREITDEQIENMGLDEYDAYFDSQGKPKPGVRVRLTRGISIRQR